MFTLTGARRSAILCFAVFALGLSQQSITGSVAVQEELERDMEKEARQTALSPSETLLIAILVSGGSLLVGRWVIETLRRDSGAEDGEAAEAAIENFHRTCVNC